MEISHGAQSPISGESLKTRKESTDLTPASRADDRHELEELDKIQQTVPLDVLLVTVAATEMTGRRSSPLAFTGEAIRPLIFQGLLRSALGFRMDVVIRDGV